MIVGINVAMKNKINQEKSFNVLNYQCSTYQVSHVFITWDLAIEICILFLRLNNTS